MGRSTDFFFNGGGRRGGGPRFVWFPSGLASLLTVTFDCIVRLADVSFGFRAIESTMAVLLVSSFTGCEEVFSNFFWSSSASSTSLSLSASVSSSYSLCDSSSSASLFAMTLLVGVVATGAAASFGSVCRSASSFS